LTTEVTVIHEESSAPAHPFTEDQDHPHACYEGVVYIGHLVEEDGEEYEAFEAVPCRRCAMGISYGKSKERRSV
jgi:hypothetical protein